MYYGWWRVGLGQRAEIYQPPDLIFFPVMRRDLQNDDDALIVDSLHFVFDIS